MCVQGRSVASRHLARRAPNTQCLPAPQCHGQQVQSEKRRRSVENKLAHREVDEQVVLAQAVRASRAEDGRSTGEDELTRVHDVCVFHPREEGRSSCGLVEQHLAAILLEKPKPRSSGPVLFAAAGGNMPRAAVRRPRLTNVRGRAQTRVRPLLARRAWRAKEGRQ